MASTSSVVISNAKPVSSVANILTIARRDFRAYFTSPIAYIFLTVFLFVMGFMFAQNVVHFNFQAMMYQQGGRGLSIADGIIRPVYGNMNIIFLMSLPLITMRSFAEEKKQHTIELLITAPVTLTQIVLGKFFSAFLFVAVTLACTLVYPAVLFATGNPDGGVIIGSYVGTLLFASCFLSLGMFFSAMTENQIVAAVLTFMSGLFFIVVSWASQAAGPVWGDLFTYLSLISHYGNFSQGLISSPDVIYYFSFIGIGLFLTHRVLDSYRWR